MIAVDVMDENYDFTYMSQYRQQSLQLLLTLICVTWRIQTSGTCIVCMSVLVCMTRVGSSHCSMTAEQMTVIHSKYTWLARWRHTSS